MIDKYIIKYLPTFPILTKTKNGIIGYLSVPAAKVIGSPIKGTHESKSDHLPYLENILFPLSIILLLMGNQDFLIK
jgi:hypothetical protein